MNTAYPGLSRGLSPFAQLGILVGLFFMGILLASLVTILVPVVFLHIPLSGVPAAITDPKNIQISRLVQFAGTLFLFAAPAFFFAMIVSRRPISYLGFTTPFNVRQFYIVLLLIIAALFAQSAFSQLNEMIPIPKNLEQYFKGLEDEYAKQVLGIAQMKSFGDYIYALVILAFLPAMFEELFFRGALQQVFIRLFKSPLAGILVASIFFSVAHASYYGFLTRLFLGMLLGYIFYYGKNIWLNITAHFLNNAIVVTSLYLLSRSGKLTEKSMQDDDYPFYVGILAIVAVFALFVFFKRESMKPAALIQPASTEDASILTDEDKSSNDDIV